MRFEPAMLVSYSIGRMCKLIDEGSQPKVTAIYICSAIHPSAMSPIFMVHQIHHCKCVQVHDNMGTNGAVVYPCLLFFVVEECELEKKEFGVEMATLTKASNDSRGFTHANFP